MKPFVILILAALLLLPLACGQSLNGPAAPAVVNTPTPLGATNTATFAATSTSTATLTNTATSTVTNTPTATRTHTSPLPTVTPTPTLALIRQILVNSAISVAARPGYAAYDYSSFPGTANVQVLTFSDSQNLVQSGSYTLGSGDGGLPPGGMAIDAYDELYVAEGDQAEVNGYYLTPTGATLDYTWSGQGVLTNATGVKIDANGNLVVSDGAGVIYNLSWSDDSVLNQTTTGPAHFSPVDVALDADGNIYAANGSYGIAEFSPAYQYTFSFTGAAWPFSIGDATSVGVDAGGNLCIANNGNDIYFSSPQGNYLGTYANGNYGPDYVSYDPSGNLWFSSSGINNAVVELSH